ncbi:Nodulation protein W [Sinorhizobium medicae]|uniref:Nodulation protein W n=1 Tax=Sinorhizobium medicae TaxID=110321 RepID=A0A508X6F3_9HYPH|nr:Nodulation protein W [Sinorhizobium medicae]
MIHLNINENSEPHGGQPSSMVFIVDDEEGICSALASLLASEGIETRTFATAQKFLECEPFPGPSCLLLDVRLPDRDGLDVQTLLGQRGDDLPIIFMTGHGTIPMTVKAMRAGAAEFLTKPIDGDTLVEAVKVALKKDAAAAAARLRLAHLKGRYDKLTPREREVMQLVIGGLMNKQIAGELSTTEVTAKVHKRRVLEKMGVKSVAELVSLAAALNLHATKTR